MRLNWEASYFCSLSWPTAESIFTLSHTHFLPSLGHESEHFTARRSFRDILVISHFTSSRPWSEEAPSFLTLKCCSKALFSSTQLQLVQQPGSLHPRQDTLTPKSLLPQTLWTCVLLEKPPLGAECQGLRSGRDPQSVEGKGEDDHHPQRLPHSRPLTE